MMSYLAVIFDLDGTVIADEFVYGAAFKSILQKLGVKVESRYPQKGGIGVRENWVRMMKKYDIKTNKSISEIAKDTQDEYLKHIGDVELKNGFVTFIESIRRDGILTALATSNEWFVVEKILEIFSIDKYFDTVTTGEEVRFKKPDPDIFLVTADKLGVDRKSCVVIEDSVAGIKAAHAAGMKTVALYRSVKHKRKLSSANLVIKDFTDLMPDFIQSL
jgi:HAD superfamily hydrolase (TIGR01509 family)